MRLLTKVAIVASLCSITSGCDMFSDHFVSACENVIKERLRSPSGYKQIKVTQSAEELSPATYDYEMRMQGVKDDLRARIVQGYNEKDKPTHFKAFIEYDAPNGFGVPIRGMAQCDYVSDNSSKASVREFMVQIDGKTQTDWLLSQIQKTN